MDALYESLRVAWESLEGDLEEVAILESIERGLKVKLLEYNKSDFNKIIMKLRQLYDAESDLRLDLKSRAISNVVYNPKQQTLRITFRKNGRTYIFKKVNYNEVANLLLSKSRGQVFNREIKPNHDYVEV